MKNHLRTISILALITMLTGATENLSIAQSTDYLKEVQNLNTTEIYQLAMVDKKEVKKEIKEEWYINELEEQFGFNYEQQKFLYKECNRRGVPYKLMLAQIRCESRFDNTLVGSDGDMGYFQIIRSIWQDYLEQELNRDISLKNSLDNLECGTLLMQYALISADKYDTEKEQTIRALNAYNQGGQSSINYARRNGWNSWHYGKRVYKCFQEYKDGNYSYDPYK